MRDSTWWDEFFADRARPIPFFTQRPDENLAEWFRAGLLSPGRVLELGCGNGRNAVYLSGLGCQVDAVDWQLRAGVLPPEGGSGYADQQVYERASLGGGLGYSEDRLRDLWDSPPFSLRVLRQMRKTDGPCFGEEFLWALLATKREALRA
jgi:Tellurite resistance protein TehB